MTGPPGVLMRTARSRISWEYLLPPAFVADLFREALGRRLGGARIERRGFRTVVVGGLRAGAGPRMRDESRVRPSMDDGQRTAGEGARRRRAGMRGWRQRPSWIWVIGFLVAAFATMEAAAQESLCATVKIAALCEHL